MRRFHFYHADTGILHHTCVSINAPDAESVEAQNCPPGHRVIEGTFDERIHRVDISAPPELVDAFNQHNQPIGKRIVHKVVDYIPPAPSPDHEWNADTKRWQLSAAVRAKAASKAEALARIEALRASQHDVVREILLGNKDARTRLQEIHDNIKALQG
jgi:hypothetical protein